MSPPGGNGTAATLECSCEECGNIRPRVTVLERDVAAIIAGERRCATDVADRLEDMRAGWSSDLGDLRNRFNEMSAKLDLIISKLGIGPQPTEGET